MVIIELSSIHILNIFAVCIQCTSCLNCIFECHCILTEVINIGLFIFKSQTSCFTNFCMKIDSICKIGFTDIPTSSSKEVILIQFSITSCKCTASAWILVFDFTFNPNILSHIDKRLGQIIIIILIDNLSPFFRICPECMTHFMKCHEVIDITRHIF